MRQGGVPEVHQALQRRHAILNLFPTQVSIHNKLVFHEDGQKCYFHCLKRVGVGINVSFIGVGVTVIRKGFT